MNVHTRYVVIHVAFVKYKTLYDSNALTQQSPEYTVREALWELENEMISL